MPVTLLERVNLFLEKSWRTESQITSSRVWLTSMNKKAILKAFNDIQPSKNFDCLGQAAKAREESDWLIGMNCTMALTKRLKSKDKLSYSVEVSNPYTRMIVDRENEISEHIPEKYWKIEAVFTLITNMMVLNYSK